MCGIRGSEWRLNKDRSGAAKGGGPLWADGRRERPRLVHAGLAVPLARGESPPSLARYAVLTRYWTMEVDLPEEEARHQAPESPAESGCLLGLLPAEVLAVVTSLLSGLDIINLWLSGLDDLRFEMMRGGVRHFVVEEWTRHVVAPPPSLARPRPSPLLDVRAVPKWPSLLTQFAHLEVLHITYSRYLTQPPVPRLAGLPTALRSLAVPALLPYDSSFLHLSRLETLVVEDARTLAPTWPSQLPGSLRCLTLRSVRCDSGDDELLFCGALPQHLLALSLAFHGHPGAQHRHPLQLPRSLTSAHIDFSNRRAIHTPEPDLPPSLRTCSITGIPLGIALPSTLQTLLVAHLREWMPTQVHSLPATLECLDLGANSVHFGIALAQALPRALTSISGHFASIAPDALASLPTTLLHLDIWLNLPDDSFPAPLLIPAGLQTLKVKGLAPEHLVKLPPGLTSLEAPLLRAHQVQGILVPTLRSWASLGSPSEWTEEIVKLAPALEHLQTSIENPATLSCFPAQLQSLKLLVIPPKSTVPVRWVWHLASLRELDVALPGFLLTPDWASSLPHTLRILHLDLADHLTDTSHRALDHLPPSLVEIHLLLSGAPSQAVTVSASRAAVGQALAPPLSPPFPLLLLPAASSPPPSSPSTGDQPYLTLDFDLGAQARPATSHSAPSASPSPLAQAWHPLTASSMVLSSSFDHIRSPSREEESSYSSSRSWPLFANARPPNALPHTTTPGGAFNYQERNHLALRRASAVVMWPLTAYPPHLECLDIRTGPTSPRPILVTQQNIEELPRTLQSLTIPPLAGSDTLRIELLLRDRVAQGLSLQQLSENSFS